MASFQKTPSGKVRVFVLKHGKRISKVFDTKKAAREWAITKEFEKKKEASGFHIDTTRTVRDAFERYRDEVAQDKKGSRQEILRLNKFSRGLLANVLLSRLDSTHIAAYRDERMQRVMPSSVNRELNTISAVFTRAVKEWKWLSHNPVGDIQRPKNPVPRDRRIAEKEIEKICIHLGYQEGMPVILKQQVLALFFLLALETAMRLGEICSTFSKNKSLVNLNDAYITLPDTKNGDKRYVPLSMKAVEICKILLDVNMSLSMESASSLFRKATRACDIKDLKFHDTRHEALTRLARKVSVLDLAKIAGHRDTRSLMIYYNATPTEIAERLNTATVEC